MDQVKTGEFLKTLRKEQKLTQEQLAEKFGISNRSVSRWENGNTLPDISLLVELAEFYNVDIGEIIAGERKEKNMNTETKEEIKAVAEYAENEKNIIKKKSKKKTVAVSVLLTAVFLVICLISNFIVGNPLSYLLVKHNAGTYVSDSPYFINSGYEINSVTYDFVIGSYVVTAMKNNSADSKVCLYYGFLGNYRWDDSDEVINGCKNVKMRMDSEYSKLVQETYESSPLPESAVFAFGSIATEGMFDADETTKHIRIIPSSELQLDKAFDYSEIGARSGMINVELVTSDLSAANLAQKLLQLKEIFDGGGVRFVSISVYLVDRDESKNDGTGYDITGISNFPYSEIYEDNLEERISGCIQ